MIGPHILLRAPEPADTDLLYRWENDPEVWHLGNTLAPYSRFQIEQFILNSGHDIYTTKQLRFMIEWHSSGGESKTVGSIDLFDFDPHHRRAGIGILIDKPFRRMGFAREALDLLTAYCFSTLNIHQVHCSIDSSNKASMQLFRSCGFEQCGCRKQWLLIGGQFADELLLQKIRPENAGI